MIGIAFGKTIGKSRKTKGDLFFRLLPFIYRLSLVGPESVGHSPLKTGLRFSLNAFNASILSFVGIVTS